MKKKFYAKRAICLLIATFIILGGFGFLTPKITIAAPLDYAMPTENELEKLMGEFIETFGTSDAAGLRFVKTSQKPYNENDWFWAPAEMFEVIIDYYDRFPTEANKKLIKDAFYGFLTIRNETKFGTNGWQGNEYNDDLMWIAIGCLRAYEILGDDFTPVTVNGKKMTLADMAKFTFDKTFARSWTSTGYGGLLWKGTSDSGSGKNSCIEYPAAIAAALMYKTFGEDMTIEFTDYSAVTGAGQAGVKSQKNYLDISQEIYKWANKYLRNPSSGKVVDNVSSWSWTEKRWTGGDNAATGSGWDGTYNLGTMVGAATMLYEFTGDKQYIDDAILTMNHTGISPNGKYKGNVIGDETNGGDLPGFKGILARWFNYSIKSIEGDASLTNYWKQTNEIKKWIYKNAETVWANRNSNNVMWTKWNTKTKESMLVGDPNGPTDAELGEGVKYYHGWGCSTALALLFCMPKYIEIPQGGYESYELTSRVVKGSVFFGGDMISDSLNVAFSNPKLTTTHLTKINNYASEKQVTILNTYRMEIYINDKQGTFSSPLTVNLTGLKSGVDYSVGVYNNSTVKPADNVNFSDGTLSFTVEKNNFGSVYTYVIFDGEIETPIVTEEMTQTQTEPQTQEQTTPQTTSAEDTQEQTQVQTQTPQTTQEPTQAQTQEQTTAENTEKEVTIGGGSDGPSCAATTKIGKSKGIVAGLISISPILLFVGGVLIASAIVKSNKKTYKKKWFI